YELITNTGNFTITATHPTSGFYTSSPISHTIDFPDLYNSYIADFCLEPTNQIYDLSIVIYPLNDPRPGFVATYRMVFKNMGTMQMDGDLLFAFDDSKLDFVNATEDVASQSNGNISFNFNALLPFESRN